LPNFLDLTFNQHGQGSLPELLVIEGVHGVGTLAAELLIKEAGLRALQDLSSKVGTARWFQAVFEAYDLELAPHGTHKFRHIRFCNWQEMPRDLAIYQRAHLLTRERLR
jgi:hypothetical protein